ncbi:MAG: hypothetical protein PHP82_02215 [Candidatus ainarchaeum sp.]|nr:hypothetical protein [Candidatus ainarchaeum sp.]
MNLGRSINEIFKFSLIDFLKNKELKKYLIFLTIIYVIFFVCYIMTTGFYYNFVANQITNYVQVISDFTLLIIIISIPLGLVITFFEYKIIEELLKAKKQKNAKIDFIRYVKFLFMPLIMTLYAALSLFKIKFLLIGIIAVLLVIIGTIISLANILLGIIVLLLGLLTGLIYFAIFIYQFIRLSMAQVALVEGRGLINALEESWKVTKNNVLNIIVVGIVFFIIIYIITMIFTIPSIIYSIAYSFTLAIESQTEMMSSVLLFDPMYNLLMLPIYLIAGYILIVQTNVITLLYLILKKK